MNNTQNIAIITLCVTAAILGGLVLGVSTDKASAGQCISASAGQFIMVPYQFDHNIDLLVVIDVSSRKMNAYRVNQQAGGVELFASVELDRAFAAE